jgi:lipooligosaccharide transport system ATP-binding protein
MVMPLQSGAKPVVQVNGLVRRFGAFTAVDELSFEVPRGQCFGLLGPNGAGKSTTLKMLLGLVRPDAGRIEVLGLDVAEHARALRARIGVVPQMDALDPDFTVTENLRIFARYFGLASHGLQARIEGLLEFAGLNAKRDARIQDLSGGMKRRLTLARALVNDPDILLLDEPTTGLDPQARHLIWERLRRLLGSGKTIVLTTHFMEEAERLCDRLIIVDHGRRIAEGSPAELIGQHIEPVVAEVSGEHAAARVRAASPGAGERIEAVGDGVYVYAPAGERLSWLPEGSSLRVLRRSANLEDVFLRLTGRDLRD